MRNSVVNTLWGPPPTGPKAGSTPREIYWGVPSRGYSLGCKRPLHEAVSPRRNLGGGGRCHGQLQVWAPARTSQSPAPPPLPSIQGGRAPQTTPAPRCRCWERGEGWAGAAAPRSPRPADGILAVSVGLGALFRLHLARVTCL